MGSSWINRLVVQGPARDVQEFSRTATDPRILGNEGGRQPWAGSRRHGLSFASLLGKLPRASKALQNREPEEPWDVCVERLKRLDGGLARRVYRFELADYEPDQLLLEISRQYPRLCFVLGWVAPDVDEQASRFIHKGCTRVYRLPAKRQAALRAHILEDGDNDAIFWQEVEADWAMLDEVVAHWDKKVATTLRHVVRDRHHDR